MRLFTGIDVPADILQRLERLLAALRPEALINWSPLDNLHITTKFIGEWPETRINELQQALDCLPAREPFDVEVKELGWFPNARSPRVLWAGVHGGDRLAELAAETEKCLEALGVRKESRAYSPHLTLARIKSPVSLARLRQTVEDWQPTILGAFQVSHFNLFRSDPGSNASIYTPLKTYRFESDFAARNR